MPCEQVEVRSWNELLDQLFVGSWQPHIGRFRSNYAFRGRPAPGGELDTGIARLGIEMEGHLLRNFRKYANRRDVPRDSLWNWLALAQHHGLPTRLLDWSYSPLVALHFATDILEHPDRPGVVWCVDFMAARRFLPVPLRRSLEVEGSNVFTAEMLDRAAGDLRHLDRLARRPFIVFLEPPSLDERIVNQFALFSLMPARGAGLEAWLNAHPRLGRRIVIPAPLKLEVRDKLDQANITERVLFPGLDGLSRWLRRQYLKP